MPLLVEHFVEHREENTEMTLWQFLYLHYATDHGQDADYSKDMQLPFKTHDNCMATVINLHLPSQKIGVSEPLQCMENKFPKLAEQFLHSSFLASIWQPPRIC